jgi:hypothetical protein
LVSSSFVGNVTSEKNEKETCSIDKVDVNGIVDALKIIDDGLVIEELEVCILQNPIDFVGKTMNRDLSFQTYEEINGEPKKILNQ